MLADENSETVHLKLAVHMKLPFPTSVFPFFYFRNANFNDFGKDGFVQMLKDSHLFTYGLLLVNSVSGIKSTI